jgi:hypothetical protein
LSVSSRRLIRPWKSHYIGDNNQCSHRCVCVWSYEE